MKFTQSTQLATLRKAKHVSQRELAERLGVKQPVISRIESGRHVPSIQFVIRFLNALGYALEVKDE